MTITVTGVNDAPTANDGSLAAAEHAAAVTAADSAAAAEPVAFAPFTLHYTRGAPCGDAADARSVKVRIFCGRRMLLLRAAEARACSYEMNVSHPVACGDASSAYSVQL